MFSHKLKNTNKTHPPPRSSEQKQEAASQSVYDTASRKCERFSPGYARGVFLYSL